MRFMFSSIFAFLIAYSFESAALEDKVYRNALVIGNKSYPAGPLKNPINDASAMQKDLEKIGFVVTSVFDANGKEMTKAIEQFYDGLEKNKDGNTLAIIYYAGHALQIQHRNYLVPLDVSLDTYSALLSSLYDINNLFEQIPNSSKIQNVIILDSCRNNPYGEFKNREGKPLIADGLAPLRAPSGTLIAYATEPGSVAYDGEGKNGTYTKHLLEHIHKKVPVEEVFKKVRRGVTKETANQQTPWEHSSLFGDVFINPARNREVPDLMAF